MHDKTHTRVILAVIFSLMAGLEVARANPATLVLVGHSNERIFAENAKFALHSAEKNGETAFVAAGDKDLEKELNRSLLPLKNVEHLRSAITAAKAGVQPGEILRIYFFDHGQGAKNQTKPETAKLVLQTGLKIFFGATNSVTYQEIGKILKDVVPSNINVHLVIVGCFSGGVHWITRQMENVCAASSTDLVSHYVFAKDGKEFEGSDHYAEAFAGQQEDPRPAYRSLLDSHFHAAFDPYYLNGNRGQLSSEDFIELSMKMGAHDPKNWKKKGKVWDYKGLFSEPRFPKPDLSAWVKNPIGNPAFENLLAEMNDTANSIETRSQNAGLPVNTQRFLRDLVKDWRDQSGKTATMLANYKNWLQRAVSQAARDKLIRDWGNWFSYSLDEPFIRLKRAQRMLSFMQAAAPSQKAKYLQLLRCESL